MNIILLLILIAGVGWIIWRLLEKDKKDLDRAWRFVLEDPEYEHRRRYYERLVISEQRKAEEDERVKKEEGLERQLLPFAPETKTTGCRPFPAKAGS
jgi:hypothetical protein